MQIYFYLDQELANFSCQEQTSEHFLVYRQNNLSLLHHSIITRVATEDTQINELIVAVSP